MSAIKAICSSRAQISPIEPKKISAAEQEKIKQLDELAFIHEAYEQLELDLRKLPAKLIGSLKAKFMQCDRSSDKSCQKLFIELFVEVLAEEHSRSLFGRQRQTAILLMNKLAAIAALIPKAVKQKYLATAKNIGFDKPIKALKENIALALNQKTADYCGRRIHRSCARKISSLERVNKTLKQKCKIGLIDPDIFGLPLSDVEP